MFNLFGYFQLNMTAGAKDGTLVTNAIQLIVKLIRN